MVANIKKRSDIELEVNLGPSFKKNTIIEMKKLGVQSITSSLECINPEIFKNAKPGDSLEKRKEILEICDEVGMKTRTMMLLGLEESDEDRIDHLFYLKDLKELYQVRLSRFMPFKNTLYSDRIQCSPWEIALTTALARIILPDVQISLAAGNNISDIPLWYLAGGGNQMMGVMLSKVKPKPAKGVNVINVSEGVYLVDKRELISNTLQGMGKVAANEIILRA